MGAVATKRTRADLAAAARDLAARGLIAREVAIELGISRSYAGELLKDPLGQKSRARKESYRRPCPDCGALMDGSNGRNAPTRCLDCTAAVAHEQRYWTRERVITAMHRWYELHGAPPTAEDWNTSEHARSTEWPYVNIVQREFGSWRAGLAAAGFRVRTWHRWSPERVLKAIRSWVAEHGDIPRADDWKRPTDEYPTSATVTHYFGTWNEAIRAAGFTPRPSGAQGGRLS